MKNYKIVTDSSADMFTLDNIPFGVAPLKIITDQKEFTDTQNLNLKEMVDFLASYKGKSSSSCPNPEDWLKTFGDSENIFCVTITGTLSGSYNSAVIAKNIYEEKHPDRKVFVINSLSAGPELRLISEKLKELILAGNSFDEICEKITEYMNQTELLFMLESMKNLANNGRVSPLIAKAAGLLGIRVVGKASNKGDLQQLNKCKGQEKALNCIVEKIAKSGCRNGKVFIAHCFNSTAAEKLKKKFYIQLPHAKVEIYHCAGLCSFYAQKGGLLVGFEKF